VIDFTVTAVRGTEFLTARELQALGAEETEIKAGAVEVRGSLETIYRTALWSRTGLRVLLPLLHFEIASQEDLYETLLHFAWHDYLTVEQTFLIDFHAIDSLITHHQYGAQRVKDAVVDAFRQREGQRPSVDRYTPDFRFSLFMESNRATLSLNLTGESLHRRGYRARSAPAPLRENLAASLLLRANWYEIARRGGEFIDPLCGSGTLLIEAALISADIAPGLLRERFDFVGWSGHDPDLWSSLVDEAKARRREGLKRSSKLFGFDRDRTALKMAQQSVDQLGLGAIIELKEKEILSLTWPKVSERGLVLTNPPYGERLGSEEESLLTYQSVGRFLLNAPPQWHSAIFTHVDRISSLYGFEISRQSPFMNGPLPCRLVEYRRDEVGEQLYDTSTQAEREANTPYRAEELVNRLRKNAAHLRRWVQRNEIEAYRVYDAQLPQYAAAIDRYADLWHVQEYAAPKEIPADKAAFRRLQMIEALCEAFEITPDQISYKTRQRQRGSQQYERLESEASVERVIHENGLKFLVNLSDYLDTGLFIDHRLTRKMVKKWASGKRVLNLFCYTASFSLYAAAGGAKRIDSVDLSNTYLEWGKRNFQLNQLTSPHWRFIQEDCLRFISRAPEGSYDLIILDPPTFSNSKQMSETLDIQRDHLSLILSCLKLLAPGGQLLFSTNRHRFSLDEASLRDVCKITHLTPRTTDRDFQRKPAHAAWLFHPLSNS
jgi:23S rRNA (guanine2445-N2)-methyltransferase / 23S rRNA (guanine2069-N7)-methyltransferase